MHWKVKAHLQNLIALLPSAMSYDAYYLMQRHFGQLRSVNPMRKIRAAAAVWSRIVKQGCDPVGKGFLEIGTGRIPIVPLAYWLMGAGRCSTIDVNRYLRWELILESLHYLVQHPDEIRAALGTYLDSDRFEALLLKTASDINSMSEFLDFCHIDYIAPGNAANLDVPKDAFDFHTSTNVLEHIPPDVLHRIVIEGVRVTAALGHSVHRIDYTDHFAHRDRSISRINFLRYCDEEWKRYASNRFMYMNRLHHDDFLKLFQGSGYTIVDAEPSVEADFLTTLEAGKIKLTERFGQKPNIILATTGAWIVSKQTCA